VGGGGTGAYNGNHVRGVSNVTDASEDYFRRLVDVERLREYLAAELGPAAEYDVRRHAEGHSNETLFVSWDDLELVIRRPPPGETADTAHDVLREFQVIKKPRYGCRQQCLPAMTTR